MFIVDIQAAGVAGIIFRESCIFLFMLVVKTRLKKTHFFCFLRVFEVDFVTLFFINIYRDLTFDPYFKRGLNCLRYNLSNKKVFYNENLKVKKVKIKKYTFMWKFSSFFQFFLGLGFLLPTLIYREFLHWYC